MENESQTQQNNKVNSLLTNRKFTFAVVVITIIVFISGVSLMNRNSSNGITINSTSSSQHNRTSISSFSSSTQRTNSSITTLNGYKNEQFTLRFRPDNPVQPNLTWNLSLSLPESMKGTVVNTSTNYTFEKLILENSLIKLNFKGALDGVNTKFESIYSAVIENNDVSSTGKIYRFDFTNKTQYASVFWEGQARCGTEYNPSTGQTQAIQYCGVYGLDKAQLSSECEIIDHTKKAEAIKECDQIIRDMKVTIN